jgi:antitoxin component YwqK of YwqJK toxin-antitoxin module
MHKYLFIALVLLTFASCKEKLETVENKDENGHLIEVYTRRVSDYAKEGLYIRYDSEGKKIEQSHYQNDTLQGERLLYYSNEKPQYLETYVKGQHEGPYKAYYETGELELEGQYKDGVMTGKWRGFYKNSQLKEVVTFENNNENGPFIEYYPNGNLKAEGTYKEGDQENGLLKLYDEQGQLERKMECNMGRCHTIWSREGDEAVPSGVSI